MPELATYIQRVKSTKGMRGRKRKSQDQEPDFYKQGAITMHEAIARATANGTLTGNDSPLMAATNRNSSMVESSVNLPPMASQLNDMSDIVRLEPTPLAPGRGQRNLHAGLPAGLPASESKQDPDSVSRDDGGVAKLPTRMELSALQMMQGGAASSDQGLGMERGAGFLSGGANLGMPSGPRSDDELLMMFGNTVDRANNEGVPMNLNHAPASSLPLALANSDLDMSANNGAQQLMFPSTMEQQQQRLQQQADMGKISCSNTSCVRWMNKDAFNNTNSSLDRSTIRCQQTCNP
ncbi:expressed unknown protein [Seminavis robusta]|uniref:Uncharacterized protein n=1 Tax=Seminavis robusta TaxID=568900 RepID=A0A9N8HWR6_9STRA|nr:expressed unknown protein [Seminavis robusta]|eukprot:Sro1688_g291280.1 n/a (293) ;mRNA; r:23478-24356